MINLSTLFAAQNGGSLTTEDAKAIDAALVQADSADIPDDQVENVVGYLDSNLLYNRAAIPTKQFAALVSLRADLEIRR